MADEGKGVALAILGVVAVIAVVGLVLLFSNASATGQVSNVGAKVYGGALQQEEYPYLVDRTAGGTPPSNRAAPRGYPASDGYAVQEDILPYGTTIAQGRESYQRQPQHIPSVIGAPCGGSEPGEVRCPAVRGLQSSCIVDYQEMEARTFSGWTQVPGYPGCFLPPGA